MIHRLFYLFAVTAVCISAQPYSGTIFDFPDAFTNEDSTAFIETEYQGQESRWVFDRRSGYIEIDAYVFTAGFTDTCPDWDMIVNPEFSREKAKELADKYAFHIGQMPMCVRTGISGAVIHDGDNLWGGGDPLTIHHGQGLSYESSGIITETMIHEATHASFDYRFYTSEWQEAADADGEYISSYARDNPTSEDHSETFLCWLVARYKEDRISSRDYNTITTTVPNRLEWYDAQDFDLSPMEYNTGINENARIASGIEHNSSEKIDVKAYPNNSGEFVNLEFRDPSQIRRLSIFDQRGRRIKRISSFSIKKTMRLRLQTGAYILQILPVNSNQGEKTVPLIMY